MVEFSFVSLFALCIYSGLFVREGMFLIIWYCYGEWIFLPFRIWWKIFVAFLSLVISILLNFKRITILIPVMHLFILHGNHYGWFLLLAIFVSDDGSSIFMSITACKWCSIGGLWKPDYCSTIPTCGVCL